MICLRPRLFVNIFQIFLFCRTTRQIQTESLLSFVYDKGSSYILCRIRKDGYQMQNIPKEYLLLFNAITDAEESLRRLQVNLREAQRQAEDLFIQEEDPTPQQRRDAS